jgi:RNA polymerase sigma factor (sigma-70 family)
MDPLPSTRAANRSAKRQQQSDLLQRKEGELKSLAAHGRKEEFFQQILPLLGPLKSYIKRQFRIAYLTLKIRTPVYTSGDILDEVMLAAYENYERKPADLSLQEWLYRLTNEILDSYLRKRAATDARRRSLESLSQAELRELGEIEHMTADVEGEVLLEEDLDDAEYQRRDFIPPSTQRYDPSEDLERKEELELILQALSSIPAKDRLVFELSAMEGFPNDAVARLADVPAGQVPKIVEKARSQVQRELTAAVRRSGSEQAS